MLSALSDHWVLFALSLCPPRLSICKMQWQLSSAEKERSGNPQCFRKSIITPFWRVPILRWAKYNNHLYEDGESRKKEEIDRYSSSVYHKNNTRLLLLQCLVPFQKKGRDCEGTAGWFDFDDTTKRLLNSGILEHCDLYYNAFINSAVSFLTISVIVTFSVYNEQNNWWENILLRKGQITFVFGGTAVFPFKDRP